MVLSPIRLSVLNKIEAHMFATGMSPSALGRQATGDHKIIARLRNGQGITLDRVEALLAWIDSENAKAA